MISRPRPARSSLEVGWRGARGNNPYFPLAMLSVSRGRVALKHRLEAGAPVGTLIPKMVRVMHLSIRAAHELEGELVAIVHGDAAIAEVDVGSRQPVGLVVVDVAQLVAATPQRDVCHPALVHVDTLAAQHVAGARVAVHVPAKHQIHLVLVQQLLQLLPQVAGNDAVGLVGEHHVHGAVHDQHHPRRLAAVHPLQIPLQPLVLR
mmetsp:Transcript_1222/g.3616  ORF Transcript_1222/g.3616 Transcript_1222/m.3616 type:complete len:205 (+) Transcript_1222:377-991(+)